LIKITLFVSKHRRDISSEDVAMVEKKDSWDDSSYW